MVDALEMSIVPDAVEILLRDPMDDDSADEYGSTYDMEMDSESDEISFDPHHARQGPDC